MRMRHLSRADLLELAVAGCMAERSVLHRADALIHQRAPLEQWCVDVLLSADLLPHVFASLKLSDKSAAVACSTWAAAWATLLRKRKHVRPRLIRTLLPSNLGKRVHPITGVVMPSGQICVLDSCSEALVVLREAGQPPSRLSGLPCRGFGMLLHDGILYVGKRSGQVVMYRATDGLELLVRNTLPGLPGETIQDFCHHGNELFVAVRTQICVLDPRNLSLLRSFGEENQAEGRDDGFTSVAVHGDSVYVADTWQNGTLKVFDRSGRFQRHVHGDFGYPTAIAFHRDRLYLIEEEIDEEISRDDEFEPFPNWESAGFRLLVLSMDGHVSQSIHLREGSASVSAMHFHGDQVYLFGGYHHNLIHVFELTDLVEQFALPPSASNSSRPVLRARRSTRRQ